MSVRLDQAGCGIIACRQVLLEFVTGDFWAEVEMSGMESRRWVDS